jgi:hypothetical protein
MVKAIMVLPVSAMSLKSEGINFDVPDHVIESQPFWACPIKAAKQNHIRRKYLITVRVDHPKLKKKHEKKLFL